MQLSLAVEDDDHIHDNVARHACCADSTSVAPILAFNHWRIKRMRQSFQEFSDDVDYALWTHCFSFHGEARESVVLSALLCDVETDLTEGLLDENRKGRHSFGHIEQHSKNVVSISINQPKVLRVWDCAACVAIGICAEQTSSYPHAASD